VATGGAPSGGGGTTTGGASGSRAGSSGSTSGGSTSGSSGAPGEVGGRNDDGGASGDGGAGGAGDGDEPVCIIESLHVKVSGGMTFERNPNAVDSCGVTLGSETSQTFITLFVKPPEVENTILMSVVVDDVGPGQTGSFTPSDLAVLTTGAIWSIFQPDAVNPLKCSLHLEKSEKASGKRWRVAGSVTCPSALSGIGTVGMTPLTLHDYRFSLLTDDVGVAQP
jgi:hypothetical protein